MKRRISMMIVLAVVVALMFYSKSSGNVLMDVTVLTDDGWTLTDQGIMDKEHKTLMTEVFSVDPKGHLTAVDLESYVAILDLSKVLVEAIEKKDFGHKKKSTYKAYETMAYDHLSQDFKVMTLEETVSEINLGQSHGGLHIEALAYSNFKGGVSLPLRLMKHLDYEPEGELRVNFKDQTLAVSPGTSHLVFKCMLKGDLVLNGGNLQAVLASFDQDIVGFVEVRKAVGDGGDY